MDQLLENAVAKALGLKIQPNLEPNDRLQPASTGKSVKPAKTRLH